ncbi:hypothetical protein G9464_07100 [Halostella sp. JP-L12]|uniref:HalOD1 output domain-containing protein n=1 Tax=Halostella TaxID=1843185 RepID=UPI000EF7F015|nr:MULTISPECIES: HalOD1 output domain-containing protein [Halostella]NHN47361.1 hypothetical protein [Halostella sp. JP-L12]
MYEYELDDDEPPSEGIPMVVAAVEDCSLTEMTQLGKRIDPDALNRLLEEAPDDEMRVRFRYSGYGVSVTCDEVRVDEAPADFP